MHSPLAVALTQAKITESIPRGNPCVCFYLHLYWLWFTDVHPINFCWMRVQLLSREHSQGHSCSPSSVTMTVPEWAQPMRFSALQPHLQWSHFAFGLRAEAQPRQPRSPKATGSAGAAVRTAVHQCIKRQECRSGKDEIPFFQKITWLSTWSSFTVEDTWCPLLPETSTPTQTRFSTFLLIMHDILKSAVCLWWCKMLRSHYNKAPGDYFLISIIT